MPKITEGFGVEGVGRRVLALSTGNRFAIHLLLDNIGAQSVPAHSVVSSQRRHRFRVSFWMSATHPKNPHSSKKSETPERRSEGLLSSRIDRLVILKIQLIDSGAIGP